MSDARMSPEIVAGPSWQALAVVVALMVGAGGIVSTFVVRLWARLNDMDKDHSDFKVKVAETYVTSATVIQVEERLVTAINRLGDRLERALDGRRHRED